MFGFFPKVLYSSHSPFSGEIKVVQKGKERQLIVGGFVQSVSADCPGVEKRVWGKIADFVNLPKANSKRPTALILGMGAGTELHLLAKKYPGVELTAVEIDPEIIKIARDYFEIDKIPNLEIIKGDAFEYVAKTRKRFDVAVCDCYAGGSYPPEADADAFLIRLSDITKVAIFNRIFDSPESLDAQEFLARLKRYFKGINVVPVRRSALNILYICGTLGSEK